MPTPEKRKPLTPSQRQKLYDEHNGICGICGHPIPPDKPWRDEHLRALGLLGTNDWENRAPVHEHCARNKDKDDLARIAKAKRQRNAYLGTKANRCRDTVANVKAKTRRPMAGSRQSDWKRTMNGKTVRRT